MMQHHPELNTMENRNMLQQLGRRMAGGGNQGLDVKKEDGSYHTLTLDDHNRVILTPKAGNAQPEQYRLSDEIVKKINAAMYVIEVTRSLLISYGGGGGGGYGTQAILELQPGVQLPSLDSITGEDGRPIDFQFRAEKERRPGQDQIVLQNNKHMVLREGQKMPSKLPPALEQWLSKMYAPNYDSVSKAYDLGGEEVAAMAAPP